MKRKRLFRNQKHLLNQHITLFQRSWREFYEKQNQAATVIQMAWRTSLKRSSEEHKQDEESSASRQGRDR